MALVNYPALWRLALYHYDRHDDYHIQATCMKQLRQYLKERSHPAKAHRRITAADIEGVARAFVAAVLPRKARGHAGVWQYKKPARELVGRIDHSALAVSIQLHQAELLEVLEKEFPGMVAKITLRTNPKRQFSPAR